MMKQEDFSDITPPKLMPGQMLKAAREAQDISIETVSKYLHLTIPTILSIEEDHYEKMPAPVYVRGYLRRYAQMVKLSPEEVLNAYEQNVEIKSKILEELPNYVKKKSVTSSHLGIRFVTYGIAVLLLILVGLWWKSHEKIHDNVALPHKTESKTAPGEPLTLQPAPAPQTTPQKATQPIVGTSHEKSATEQSVSSEKEKKAEVSNDVKSESQNPITESKFRVTPNPSAKKAPEQMEENTGIKDRNSRTRPARQPSNALDLY